MDEPQRYIITDGKMVLNLYQAEEGGFFVQGAFNPALCTQGETLKELFDNARDAAATLALPDADAADEPQQQANPAA